MSMQADAEQPLFADAVVTVTRTRAIIAGTTYAMANITSVRTFVQPRPILFLLLGIFLEVLVIPVGLRGSAGPVLLLGGFGSLGLWWLTKPKHWVRIATAGVESNATYSTNPEWTSAVVTAINEAIVSRG